MKFNNKGQTLIEAVIALSIIITIMTVTTVAVISSLNNANFVRSQTQANKLSQEGMEYVRDQIMNNGRFTTFSTSPYTQANGYCLSSTYAMESAPTGSICTQLIDGKFSRVVRFTNALCSSTTFTNGVRALVTVYWRDGKCGGTTYCHSQESTSCFINPSKSAPSSTAPTGI